MSPLQEIEAVVPKLSVQELADLEKFVRIQRRKAELSTGQSVLELPPLNFGKMIRPLGPDDDLLGEMLDDTRF